MLRSLDFLPLAAPTLPATDFGGLGGPQYALHRPTDVGGTLAAWRLWILWLEHGVPGRRLTVPLTGLTARQPTDDDACEITWLSRAGPREIEGAGFALFPDLSVIVLKRDGAGTVTLLPLALRIDTALQTRYGVVRPRVLQDPSGLTLSFAQPFERAEYDAPKAVRENIWRVAAAWAAWIDRTPPLAPPGTHEGAAWPAFFTHAPGGERLAAFRADVLAAARGIMAWHGRDFRQAQVMAFSSRPLQGGIEPLQLVTNWQLDEGAAPWQSADLTRHISNRVFGPASPWSEEDFPGIRIERGSGGPGHASAVELFVDLVHPPRSAHERLSWRSGIDCPEAPELPRTHA